MAINTLAFGSAIVDLYSEQVVAGGYVDWDEGGDEGAFGPHAVADRPEKYGVLCAVNTGVGGVGQDDGAVGDNRGGVARSKGAHFYGVDAVVDFQAGGAICPAKVGKIVVESEARHGAAGRVKVGDFADRAVGDGFGGVIREEGVPMQANGGFFVGEVGKRRVGVNAVAQLVGEGDFDAFSDIGIYPGFPGHNGHVAA